MTTEQSEQLQSIYDYIYGGIISSGYITIAAITSCGDNSYCPRIAVSVKYNNTTLISITDSGTYQANGSGTSKTSDITIDDEVHSFYVYTKALYGDPSSIPTVTLKINNGNNISLPVKPFDIGMSSASQTYNCKLVKEVNNYGLAFI